MAERATALGYPLTRDTVINVELGRKKTLDICEIVILAKVLDVAPLSLLYPDLVDTPVEALPCVDNTTGGDAALAFCGYDEKGPMMALFRLHDSRAWYDFDKSQAARNSLLQGIRAANDRGWTVDE